MSKFRSTPGTPLLRAGIAAGVAAATVLATATPAFAEAKLTLSQSTGPAGGTNTITAVAPTPVFTMAAPVVSFVTTGTAGTAVCPTSYSAPVAIAVNATSPYAQTAGIVVTPAASVRKVSNSKIAVTIPSTALNAGGSGADLYNANGLDLGTNQITAKYNMCVYAGSTPGNTTTSGLIASGTYTIADAPTVTSISPASGPALGGTKITVVGTGFTSGMTATIGGNPLTSVTVTSDTGFTAVLPAHVAAADLPIVVNTTGGRVTSTPLGGAGGVDFSYVNGIEVTPNTSAGNTVTTIDITGVGFQGLDWASANATTVAARAHVFLVAGAYNNAAGAGPPSRINGPVTECQNVLVISDTELICDIDTTLVEVPADDTVAAGTVPEGAYVVTIVSTGAVGATGGSYYQTRVTSGSIFTVAAY